MSIYSATMIARAEHEEMIRSLPAVPEYGLWTRDDQPRWVSRQAGRLLYALGKRLKHEQVAALETPHAEQAQNGVPA